MAFTSAPFYGYYDYLGVYYETFYEQHHNRLINKTCDHRSAASLYYNSSIFFNPLCDQIRNKTAYKYEPEHPFPGEYVVPPLASLSILCCIASISIAILFFYQLATTMKKNKKRSPDKITIIISSTSIIFHALYNIIDFLALHFYLIDYDADTYTSVLIIWETFWALGKISLYGVFAYRYFVLYNASSFAKGGSTFEKYAMFGSIIFVIFLQLALQITYIVVQYKYQTAKIVSWRSDMEMELYYFRLYLDISWAEVAIDFLLIGVLGFLIIRNLLQLVVMMDFHSDHSEFSKYSVASNSVQSVSSVSNPSNFKLRKNKKQMDLIEVSTRIAVTCLFSMISTFIVFVSELTIQELEHWHLSFIAYFWCVDNVINMLCLNFSMAFSKKHYKIVCQQYCFCHQSLFWCLNKCVTREIDKKHRRELEEGKNAPNNSPDLKQKEEEDVIHIIINTSSPPHLQLSKSQPRQ